MVSGHYGVHGTCNVFDTHLLNCGHDNHMDIVGF